MFNFRTPWHVSVADVAFDPSKKKEKRERERDGEGTVFHPSIKHISIHSFAC